MSHPHIAAGRGGPELVTGEAVVLDLRPAGFATRGLALALDLLVQVVLVIAVVLVTDRLLGGLDDAAAQAFAAVLVLALFVGLPVLVETLTHGKSLGKLAAGLRVVRTDGGTVRARQSLTRALIALGEIYLMLGSGALIASLSNDRGQRVGDLAAGTYVVRERTAARGGGRAQMPPRLERWARTADIGRLPDPLALAMRQYVARRHDLAPGSSEQVGRQLATEASAHVAPMPPAGTSPWEFVNAVLAERRRRDTERLHRQQLGRQAYDRAFTAAADRDLGTVPPRTTPTTSPRTAAPTSGYASPE